MRLHSPAAVLKALSEGQIGWRQACRELHLENFSALQAYMEKYNAHLYQPSPEISVRKMTALNDILYGEDDPS